MEERLQKLMAELGVASRRKCEELILQGRVKVDGQLVKELGTKVDKQKAVIEVDGLTLHNHTKKVYIVLNKPVGYITSVKDQFGRPTVLDLIPEVAERVFPIGRLDYDTEGLLLLTNDGELTYKLTHPSHNVDKTYNALISGRAEENTIKAFENGLIIDDYKTAGAKLEILRYTGNDTLVNITIHEGRNRQVRKMCDAVGHHVKELRRISIGRLTLSNLGIGHWRYLNSEEIDYLYCLGDKL